MKTNERSAFDDATDETILRLYASYEREQNMRFTRRTDEKKMSPYPSRALREKRKNVTRTCTIRNTIANITFVPSVIKFTDTGWYANPPLEFFVKWTNIGCNPMRKQSEATSATVNMRFLFVFNFFLFFPDDDDGTSKSSKEWSRDDVIFSEEKEDIISATMRFKKSAFFHFVLSVFFVGVVSEEDNNNTKRRVG